MHAAGSALDLVGKGRLRRGGPPRVRHLKDAGNAAEHGCPRAGFKIFLVLHPGFAEMDLGVDDAGKDVEAGAIDALAGVGGKAAKAGDSAIADPDITDTDSVLIDDLAAGENEIETGCQIVRPASLPCGP